jgi:hypothetical protein
MAKKQGTLDPSANLARQQGKQDKKLAKREAKAMLEVDVAREKLGAAEKKLARAQLRLEARRTRLQAAEAHLTELRNSHQPAGASGAVEDAQTADETASSSTSTGYADMPTTATEESENEFLSTSSSDGASQADVTAAQDSAGETATPAGGSSASDEPSGESESNADEDLLPEDTLPTSEAQVDTTAVGQSSESEQAQQEPWWKRVAGNHGQHDE